MKKNALFRDFRAFAALAFLALGVLLLGCLDGGNQGGNQGGSGSPIASVSQKASQVEDDLAFYKGIPGARIPGECLAHRNDVCALFDCMTESCWCAESPDAILAEGKNVVESESQAVSVVSVYLQNAGSEFQAKRAVKINNVFYNVFAENAGGGEAVYTVAADGTVIETVCGV